MLSELITNKKFKIALTVAGAIALALTIYETYQNIKLNNEKLEQ